MVRSLDVIFSREFLYYYIRPIFINGFAASLVVMYTLRIFEFLFGVLTNFSLIELSDKDHPLLKRMSLEAPGTYHHSMVVSDISEAAAYAIGANALLTRVGAYYHDIGKIVKPEYFTENQLMGGNKHDSIEPSVSRLVILNHVKEGLELAKKYKLNPVITQFIPQHHGTGLIYYFYQKALEGAQDKTSVHEDIYRYPGPKPQLRETATVLLADSVEGAVRSLEDPTLKKIEETVRKIINNKFIDGQLDECQLTLKEIDQIASTFTRVLSAMYHSRVKYPEKKNGIENRNRKSADKGSSQPASD
jgi:putative nucleotidyltransferase with HDIG domain